MSDLTLYQILSLVGVPSMLLTFAGYTTKKLQELQALKAGLQALLRHNLINEIYKYLEKGYAPVRVRDNVSNMYVQYHALGKNGVMDDLYEEFMKLPVLKPSEDDHGGF